jgi:hypothetical protein
VLPRGSGPTATEAASGSTSVAAGVALVPSEAVSRMLSSRRARRRRGAPAAVGHLVVRAMATTASADAVITDPRQPASAPGGRRLAAADRPGAPRLRPHAQPSSFGRVSDHDSAPGGDVHEDGLTRAAGRHLDPLAGFDRSGDDDLARRVAADAAHRRDRDGHDHPSMLGRRRAPVAGRTRQYRRGPLTRPPRPSRLPARP